ncbi:response regulator transcription factor [Patescibacteria group bacterium]|nr:response regulator transcription factor [Patescibacteria group bacterium]
MNKKYKILIVDDDKLLLDMYSVKFNQQGFDVVIGIGGEDALAKLRDGLNPDVILLDLVMPDVDGFDFFEIINREKLCENPIVIILTNQGQESDIKRAKELGAAGYIVKASALPSEVLEQVMKIIEEKTGRIEG